MAVRGTEFEIAHSEENDITDVKVKDGEVSVAPLDNKDPETKLSKGEGLKTEEDQSRAIKLNKAQLNPDSFDKSLINKQYPSNLYDQKIIIKMKNLLFS